MSKRNTTFRGPRVWLIEIERAKGDTPAGIAVWRSRGDAGEWRTRFAGVWTHGRVGSTTHPLVIGAQWGTHGGDAASGADVIGPSWEDATRAAKDASRSAVLARRQQAIGTQMTQIAVPAALGWLDEHGGDARPVGRVRMQERGRANLRNVRFENESLKFKVKSADIVLTRKGAGLYGDFNGKYTSNMKRQREYAHRIRDR